MAKRSGSEKRQRTVRRAIRFSPAEDAAVEEMAKATGHSFSDLVRHALFSTPPPRRQSTDKEMAARLLAEVARIKGEAGKHGSNLNQIAHQLNLLGPDRGLQRIREQLAAVLEQVAMFYDRDTAELRIAILQFLGFERAHKDDPD